ncbi:hypothetical protein SAMD00019534_032930 [Acytostelium subglobosum LB1]|uniref:hypothetical protein n=1 Tax=Acytostelium subglobosum LB1 TaxID=1410327 RepID=UPI00064491D6|nr:hypothetical protein SAMD00019534_032930 [Acytostelium subglobosum LB1]GAM20118.1 hypothetical protein SAMD00019534_032930 [Acytostelium subglobosum LB1]|eukprot:XP_012756880.1 hypothetical protein SAMD00019534_032930 [Acytostelium subglobosum LB1]
MVICSHCSVLLHNGHILENVDIIRKLIADNKYDRFPERLTTLCHQMKHLTTTYQSLDKTSMAMSEQFRKMHELLVIEEHRIKSPIIEEMKRTVDVIKSIMKEVVHLANIQPTENPSASPEVVVRDVEEDDQDIKVVEEANVDDKPEDMTLYAQPKQSILDITDSELFYAIQRCEKQSQTLRYAPTKLLRVEIDESVTDLIKKSIDTCFTLVDSHKYHSHYVVVASDTCTLVNLTNNTPAATLVGYKTRTNVVHSTVYAATTFMCLVARNSPTHMPGSHFQNINGSMIYQ